MSKPINYSFLRTLYKFTGLEPFTNRRAYSLYVLFHVKADRHVPRMARKYYPGVDTLRVTDLLRSTFRSGLYALLMRDPFVQATVRNTLCSATDQGVLQRLKRGRYQFVPGASLVSPYQRANGRSLETSLIEEPTDEHLAIDRNTSNENAG